MSNLGLSEIILFEMNNDEGLVDAETGLLADVSEEVKAELAAQQAQAQQEQIPEDENSSGVAAPEGASESASEQVSSQPQITEEDLTQYSISQTQDLFTKMYLINRVNRLTDWIDYLLRVLDKKVDTDYLYALENYKLFLDILNKMDIAIPTNALYHLVASIEYEILDMLNKMKDAIESAKFQEANDANATRTDIHG